MIIPTLDKHNHASINFLCLITHVHLLHCSCSSLHVVFDKRDNLLFFRILTMGLAILAVPFLPASNIFFTVGFVVAERVLYLSSIGSCLITVLGFAALSKKYFGKKVSRMMYSSIYSLVTLQRRVIYWFEIKTAYMYNHVCYLGAMLFLAMWLDLLEEAIVFLQGKHSIRQIMGSIYPLNLTDQKRSTRRGST